MTTFHLLTPSASRLLDIPTKRGLRVHGSVKLPGFVYGSCRHSNLTDGPVHFIKIDDSNSGITSYETTHLAELADFHTPNLDCLVFGAGFLWTVFTDGSNTFVARVDPTSLACTITEFAISSLPSAAGGVSTCDGEFLYLGCLHTAVPSQIGLHRIRLSDMSHSLLGNASWSANAVDIFPHSSVADAEHVYFSFPQVGAPSYLIKADKTTGELLGKIQIPTSTDDMCHWTSPSGVGWLFLGWEVRGATDFGFGMNVGAIAVRKSDLAVFFLPKLGPEDNDAVISYGSLVFGNHLLDTKTNNHTYVIDLTAAAPSTWATSMSTEQKGLVIAKDITWDLPGGWTSGGNSNNRIPNEVLADEEGVFHFFAWPSAGGGAGGDALPGLDAASGYFRATIPGLVAVPPTVSSLIPTGSGAADAVLRGVVESNEGGTVVETGFEADSFTPPTTKHTTTITPQIGTFSKTITPSGGGSTFYVRAYATSNMGTGKGEIIQYSTPIATSRGFTGTIRTPDDAPVADATVYIVDAATGDVIATAVTDSSGVYSITHATIEDFLRTTKAYHLFAAAVIGGSNRRALSKTSRAAIPF